MFEFLARLRELVRPYRVRLCLGVAAGVVAGLAEPLMVAVIPFTYNVLFPSANSASLSKSLAAAPPYFRDWVESAQHAVTSGVAGNKMAAILLVCLIPLTLFIRSLFGYLNVYLLQWVAWRTVTDLNVKLFRHLLTLPMSFFNKTSSGELMSRMLSDTNSLQMVLSGSVVVIVKDPVTVVVMAAVLLWQQPKLTLVALVVLPLGMLPIIIFGRKIRKSSHRLQSQVAESTVVMSEGLTSVRVVKSYNLEKTMGDGYAAAADRAASTWMRIFRASELPGPLLEFIGSIGVAILLAYMAIFNAGRYAAADLLTLVLALFTLYKPLKNLTRLHNNLLQANSASARVFELLAMKSHLIDPVRPKSLKADGAAIAFEGVDFAYGDKKVLNDIHLTIRPGQLVAFVGESGSGKTTLTNLLLRFDDPARGSIKIGGVDIRDFNSSDLRSQIAVVTQETILFNETISRNIELGRIGAAKDEIILAAKQACAHEFILAKPEGYQTLVGEKGVTLSGGQRQRIAIARAILKGAPILVLDEATNALDTASEFAVQEALSGLMKGRTTLCIAHRLSTIQHADLIVVMDHGRIVETGTHEELLSKQQAYRRLYDMQFKTQESSEQPK